MGYLPELGHDLFRDIIVHIDHGDGLSGHFLAAYIKTGDIDPVAAQGRPQFPDDSGPVLVGHPNHVAHGSEIGGIAVEVDDPELLFTENGPGNRVASLLDRKSTR